MIFAILYSRYRSAVLALIIMGSVPLALIGSVAALWMAGQPLSVASMIGFITLTGIASRNGILKISHYINLALHENMPFGRDLVVRGSLERMTPVLMTALAAGFALLPLMIDAGAPGKEVLHPVAITIFGGLISATLLDAFLTPILFLRFGEKPLARLLESARAPEAGRLGPVQLTPTDTKETSMKRILLAITAALLATTAFAHGPNKGPNGGAQVDAGDHHVEMVAKDATLAVYLQ